MSQLLLSDFTQAKEAADKVGHFCTLCSLPVKHIRSEPILNRVTGCTLGWRIYYCCIQCNYEFLIIPKDKDHFWMNAKRGTI